jgi:hypothetical protein
VTSTHQPSWWEHVAFFYPLDWHDRSPDSGELQDKPEGLIKAVQVPRCGVVAGPAGLADTNRFVKPKPVCKAPTGLQSTYRFVKQKVTMTCVSRITLERVQGRDLTSGSGKDL